MKRILGITLLILPPVTIPLLPKSLPETAYIIAVYLIIFPTSFLIAKFLILNSKFIIRIRWFLVIFMILYSIYLFLMSLARYYNFRSEIIDLSFYDHVVLELSQFKIPKVWDIPEWYVWGGHFDGILFLFAPLYWLKREPAFLMAIQSGLAILTTIPIYLYAKEKFKYFDIKNLDLNKNLKLKIKNSHECQLSKLLALSLSFAYILFGAHQMGYLYGFHEIVMFPFFFFWMLYFLETKRKKLFLLFLFLTTIIKEETFMYLIFLGFYFFYLKFNHLKLISNLKFKISNYSLPLLFILTGVLWYLFTFQLIFPHFYPHWDIHTGLYSNLSSFKGIVELLQPYKLGTIINHLAPFGFLPLLYPPSLIVTIPAWAQKLLTNDIASLSGFHYSSALIALIIFASIEAIEKFFRAANSEAAGFSARRYPEQSEGMRALQKLAASQFASEKFAIFIILTAFCSNFFLGYSLSSFRNLSLNEFQKTPGQQTAYDFMKEIPKDASVSASYILAPHLKKPTGKILPIPRNIEDSEYVLINHNISIPLTTASFYKQYLVSLEKNYEILKSQNNIFLLKRK